jgi:hypothetical protein
VETFGPVSPSALRCWRVSVAAAPPPPRAQPVCRVVLDAPLNEPNYHDDAKRRGSVAMAGGGGGDR